MATLLGAYLNGTVAAFASSSEGHWVFLFGAVTVLSDGTYSGGGTTEVPCTELAETDWWPPKGCWWDP